MKRLVVLVALLLVALPARPFGQNKIVYDTFKWNVYHSTHFDVYFYDEERPQLQRVVDAAQLVSVGGEPLVRRVRVVDRSAGIVGRSLGTGLITEPGFRQPAAATELAKGVV